ncbi:dynein heavy chain 6 [Volvox carteri f. nagariensis]|uniref:Dynein axonemal heavy chain 7 n=1 Tax=Volvox carteri f. nagariensis TaxID=3068 RepID=D8TRN2_VOLCA|nr:dynein heavy chain 6 [Volvox carteri f. nagariensis]EFJ50020.1 dynein heavy chain 6 [Volvox carteri f. nagariensis]|eukprot:XP_002949085.1 dynein heavy chain 6 [Volvox carteri f. nagariensis]
MLHAAQHELANEAADTHWRLLRWPLDLAGELSEVRSQLARWRGRYLSQLKADSAALVADLAELQAEVERFVTLGDLKQVDDRMATVLDIDSRLKSYQDLADLYGNREEIFGLPRSEYPVLEEIRKVFTPSADLWRIASEFMRSLPEWLDGPFTEIDAETVAADVDRWWRATAKLAKQLDKEPGEVVAAVRAKLEDFQVHLPLITALRNPGLRDRHWERISTAAGFPVRADAGFSLSRALQLGLPKHLVAIAEVAEYASKEYSLERALDKMQADWAGVVFDTMPWRSTGTTILRALDDVQMLLDDQIVKTQSMRASPYIGPFEDRVRLWEAKLSLTQETLDQWLRCQQGWLYLEPIFGSEDIMQQMPNEGRKFKAVDHTWRRTMEKLSKNAEVLTTCADDEQLKALSEANKLLEQVTKGLNDYLETKRLAFPRFYFLSNDELLEILSETKDPTRVQPFLRKIFEGINGLEFQPDGQVAAMFSEEGEKVTFKDKFNPQDSQGNVERWLIECELAMRTTLKDTIRRSHGDYAKSMRINWVTSWPGQVVICVDCMYWTKEVGDAISKGTLMDYAQQCTDELMKVVNMVRGKLTKLDRKTLSALIVIDVHARDVVVELANAGVTAESDFAWNSQLRYGWEGGDVTVRMINAQIKYGYEYLGNGSRLVITPLTDRCYRTLMGALHLNLGGAPEGPAGTGKTETTKDLAKAIAMQCVVFNCSDGLDYQAMGKFFKGLASSGAWACFDEFNRIDLEVLSVIAQQILTMQRAKASGVSSFEFEGTKLSLRPTFSVFITMNPGYAGRSELPDNLKALFRSVAMMVPDYALISEIMLYSSGYLKARDLARKLVATYRLCSEQLSSQSHYDYGMRAVMSVLRAAAANKQRSPDTLEDVLMLRSIKDVNEPKFLAPDLPLFAGILSDLFPGVDLPATDYSALDERLKTNCGKLNLQPTSVFLDKAHQLYEMILVRHGLMLVGYSYGAKTSIYRALAGSLGDLEAAGLMEEHRVQLRIMNPKSITMGQLYGQFDPVSHEWKDGVLAKLFREAANETTPDRKWVLFDGPVDAVWIENMNTVLDDNKKLCLNSGEIIQMSASMNMIFEVQDLAVASPATVSRCGMVYVEPQQLGWRPLRDSWVATLPACLSDDAKAHIMTLSEWLVDPCVAFVRKNCRELVPTADISLPNSLMHIMTSMMDELKDPKQVAQMGSREVLKQLDGIFVFALVWSVGATTDTDGRAQFNDFVRKLLEGSVSARSLSQREREGGRLSFTELWCVCVCDGLVYDYVWDKSRGAWRHWMEPPSISAAAAAAAAAEGGAAAVTPLDGPIPESASFNEIIVPTVDTVRYTWLMTLLATHGRHVLFAGPTGTGKTVYVKAAIEALDKAAVGGFWATILHINCHAKLRAVQCNGSDIIDNRLDKRRKGIFGPPVGMRCVIFVDDVNMPALEVYGAQPPVELLRQFLDHSGWYDRTDNTWRQLVDIQLVCAMGPPGGGRNPVTPRFLRHFNLVAITEFDDATYTRIYGAICDWWFRRARIPEEVRAKGNALVKATLEIYNTIRAQLLPTPDKSHYTYNMRDLSKVFQGVQSIGVPVPDARALTRLWAHETLRVFHDRLVSDEDRNWYCSLLKDMVNKLLGLKFDNVFEPPAGSGLAKGDVAILRNLLYCDFQVPGADPAKYDEVTDLPKLLSVVQDYLADYNAQSKSRMDLVLFLFAAEHICRISRIIKQPYGNALLVGVGGSGRQSLTRIATFMADYKLFTIEISKSYTVVEWRDDLKRVLRQAGGAAQPTVFLFSDTQLKDESFLEDINNILNTGEVPNLFPKDELVTIMEQVTPRAKRAGKPLTPASLYAFFVDACRANLHLVLAMSPVGGAFRERLRKFPSLVNCTTIDWFSVWPSDALKSVASKFLNSVEMDSAETRAAVEDMCMEFHLTVRHLAEEFKADLGRHYYTTPTSYLELIQTYKELLSAKRKQVHGLKRRYEVGLEKLLSAEHDIGVMKEELIALQPKLIETGKEVEETLKIVDRQTQEAEAKKVVVVGEEAVANEKAASAKAIKDECEADLAVALPLLESALKALDTLTKADITEVKAMKNPPKAVKVVMEAVCQMLSIKPNKVNDPANPARKINDYWGPSQGLLADTKFLDTLRAYDKDNIPPPIIAAVRPYLDMDDFDPAVVKKASAAAYGLCCWVRAMEAYDRVAKVVAPKKAKLAEAEAEYSELMVGLNEKKAELANVEAKLAGLNAKLAEMQRRKAQLEAEVDLCEKKLDRATKLIGGLGGEKSRWTEVAAKLGGDYVNLTGDVLLASGFIAYLGAFTAAYRERASSSWVALCRERHIPCSEHFKLVTVLGEPVKIRDWTIDGLPNDSFSIDNGIIVSKARRWPLLIDPQGQANKWIKNMEKKNKLEVMKLSDGDYIRRLENAIQFGTPVLLENIGEELDPTLEPLLLKSVFRQGGGLCIRLGDATIEYSESFKFYMTTKLRNPHYLPEVSVKVTLLNFMITPEVGSGQWGGQRGRGGTRGRGGQGGGREGGRRVVTSVHTARWAMEDETAINVISSSKQLSNDIAQKQQIADKTERTIDETRLGYKPVARHVSVLFFCISDLAAIEPMYQYSLLWFVNLFEDTIARAEKSKDLTRRIEALIAHFTYSLYVNICRSLFEKDKLLFSFSLTVAIRAHIKQALDLSLFRFLLTGGISTAEAPPNPSDWLADRCWAEMVRLAEHWEIFRQLPDSFREDPGPWRSMYDSADPTRVRFPEPWHSKLDSFQKLLIIRLIRPDKLVGAIQNYVLDTMGQKFIEPPPFDLDRCYQNQIKPSPTLSPQLLPILLPYASEMPCVVLFPHTNYTYPSAPLSSPRPAPPRPTTVQAARLIEAAQASGGWVVLQNCHLAVSWMPTLERLCEGLSLENTSPAFRLWLTSYPSPAFPVSVLQNGIKMTNDPPKGLRANLLGSYLSDPVNDNSFFEGCSRPAIFKKLLFGLCFFHAFVQERLKFGPLGWNVPYQFSAPDFVISARQLQMFLNEMSPAPGDASPIPLPALRYLTGECNYGGRVTDAHDRRTLMSILDIFYCPAALQDGYSFSPSGRYYAPPEGLVDAYLSYIRGLPIQAEPEVFGLHANADITKDQQETDLMLSSLLAASSGGGAGGGGGGGASERDAVLAEVAADITSRVPQPFDIEAVRFKYPVDYYESMNTVLCQELVRFNRLLEVIHDSLAALQKALRGLVLMSSDLEALGSSMYDGRVPKLWMDKSYPSLKPLAPYVADLIERCRMMSEWVAHGPPPVFWISGFYFTHAFLTGVKQNYARKHRIPIDTITFNYACLAGHVEHYKVRVYLFMYACVYVCTYSCMLFGICVCVLFSPAPLMKLSPCDVADQATFPHYECPLYRTPERRGVLATTGHSTNFVMELMIPSDQPQDHWIRRGVAFLLSLAD